MLRTATSSESIETEIPKNLKLLEFLSFFYDSSLMYFCGPFVDIKVFVGYVLKVLLQDTIICEVVSVPNLNKSNHKFVYCHQHISELTMIRIKNRVAK